MGARSGEQFLQGLRRPKRQLWLAGQRVGGRVRARLSGIVDIDGFQQGR